MLVIMVICGQSKGRRILLSTNPYALTTFYRVFASDMFYTRFKANPLDQTSGKAYREHILRPGGSKYVWVVLFKILQVLRKSSLIFHLQTKGWDGFTTFVFR